MVTGVQGFIHTTVLFMEQKLLESLSVTQKRVAAVAAGIFALLAAYILFVKFCSRKSDIQAGKADQPALAFKPEQKSKIPTISGWGLLDYQKRDCEDLFNMVYDKKFLDPEKDQAALKIIDDFASFTQTASFDNKVSVTIYDNQDQSEITKEVIDKGCHFRVYTSRSGHVCRELSITLRFLADFKTLAEPKSTGAQADLRGFLLRVVDELNEALKLEAIRKSRANQ